MCIKHGSSWFSMFQYTDIFESPCMYWNTKIQKFLCFIHGDFWISMYWNTEIGKYEHFCLPKSPCFNTWRFLNLCVLKHRDSKILTVLPYKNSMFQYMEIFLNSVYWNTEIQKSPCFNHGNFLISMYWNTEIQKSSCFETQRLNFV